MKTGPVATRSSSGRALGCSRGYTLIELIVILVVVSVALAALLGIFSNSVGRSADPMLRMQAIAIAQGYLEEALLKAYQDPDGGETGTCEEAGRDLYDDVQDYNCINDTAGAVDQFGNTLAGLGAYNVSVSVSATTLGAANAQQVVVTVTHDSAPLNITLTGFRAQY
jgi:MSHA pilin protein MshD